VGVGSLDKVKLRLTQPQVELEAWAEVGKIVVIMFAWHLRK
jgi:hypothetical protein